MRPHERIGRGRQREARRGFRVWLKRLFKGPWSYKKILEAEGSEDSKRILRTLKN